MQRTLLQQVSSRLRGTWRGPGSIALPEDSLQSSGNLRSSLCGRREVHGVKTELSYRRQPQFRTSRRWYVRLSHDNHSSPKNAKTDAVEEATIVRDGKSSANQGQEVLEQRLQKALERYREVADHNDDSLTSKTEIKESLQDVRNVYEALEYWDQALLVEQRLYEHLFDTQTEQSREATSQSEQANALYRMGKLHMRLRQLGPALQHYQQAQQVLEELLQNDSDHDLSATKEAVTTLVGNLWIAMAGVHYHRGRYEESLQHLLHAQSHLEELIDTNDGKATDSQRLELSSALVKSLQHQGLVHRSVEDFETALTLYQQALSILSKQVPGELLAYNFVSTNETEPATIESVITEQYQSLRLDIADMMAALEQLEPAIECYEAILADVIKRVGSSTESGEKNKKRLAIEAIVRHSTGKLHAQLRNYDIAIAHLQTALACKQQVLGDGGETHPEVAKTLNTLGSVYAVTNEKLQALECFQQSLLIARMHASIDEEEEDPLVMFALRNIAVLKGEAVPKWGEDEDEIDDEQTRK